MNGSTKQVLAKQKLTFATTSIQSAQEALRTAGFSLQVAATTAKDAIAFANTSKEATKRAMDAFDVAKSYARIAAEASQDANVLLFDAEPALSTVIFTEEAKACITAAQAVIDSDTSKTAQTFDALVSVAEDEAQEALDALQDLLDESADTMTE
jgi:hypothetical protein